MLRASVNQRTERGGRPDGRERRGGAPGMIKEFRDFIMRGNVLDLAVAVIIGAAFTAVVSSLSADIITPIIGVFGGTPNFSGVAFTINGSVFKIGSFINAVIQFLITALILFFVVIKPMNMLIKRMSRAPEAAPSTKPCPYCLTEIPIGATRCPACTSDLAATAARRR
jgi:large conductance mechanosensitive channel